MRYLLLCALLVGCGESIAELKLKREETNNIAERAWVSEYAASQTNDPDEAKHRKTKEDALLRIKDLDRRIEAAAAR